jgi:hypothetical protein
VRLVLRKMAIGVGVVSLAVVAFAMYAVGGIVVYWAVGLPLPCAGQCQSPYLLQVTFRTGTSYLVDATAMVQCIDHSPEGAGTEPAGLDPNHSGTVIGIVRTNEFGGGRTAPVINGSCDPSVGALTST